MRPMVWRKLGITLAVAVLLVTVGTLAVAARGASPAATWRDFGPTDWVAALPAEAYVTVEDPQGLAPDTAAYRTTTDGGTTWSEWRTTYLATAQPVTTSLTLTVTHLAWPDGDGPNQIAFRVENQVGELAESPAYPLRVDTTPPTVTVTNPVQGETYRALTLAGTAADATSGVAQVEVALSGPTSEYWNGTSWQQDLFWLAATGTVTWTYDGPTPTWQDGTYTVRARATDRAGHQTLSLPVAAQVDATPPGPPQNVRVSPDGWTNQNDFTVTWDNPADPSGIAGVWYRVGSAPTTPTDGTFLAGEDPTELTGITVPAEGRLPVYIWLQDGVGNTDQAQAAAAVLRYDATPPGAPVALVATPTGWTRENDFSLTWTNPPDISGIGGAYYRLDSEPATPTDGTWVPGDQIDHLEHIQVPEEGAHAVYLWLADVAGNVDQRTRNLLVDAFRYDVTPPEVSLNVQGTPGEQGWYTSAVTVSIEAQDALAGIAEVRYALDGGDWVVADQVVLDENGEHVLQYQAQDAAGNVSDVQTTTLRVDRAAPQITYDIRPDPDASGWYLQPITISLDVQDVGSGVAEVRYRLDDSTWMTWTPGTDIRFAVEGSHFLTVEARDRAGNLATLGPIPLNLDFSPPSTAYVVDGMLGNDGWYTSTVTVILVPSDAGSGVSHTYYRVDDGPWLEGTTFAIEQDGQHTITFYSVDRAGWEETGYPTPIWIDTTPPPAPPFVTVNPGFWSNRNAFTVTWATPSDLSMVEGAYYKLDQPPTSPHDGTFVPGGRFIRDIQVPDEGVHTLYLWLQDGAGNADHQQAAVVPDGLRYDATPPESSARLTGLVGENGWYRSPVTVTVTSTDTLSGLANTFISVDNGPWRKTAHVLIDSDEKHTVQFYATDRAGNSSPVQSRTVRVDTQPPPAPTEMSLLTEGWQRENRFIVRWTPPIDLSGIGGVRYTVGAPPTGPDDGTFSPGVSSAVLTAPAEGTFDLYVWLVDGAGNGDPSTAAYFPQGMWYDATPPDLDVTVTGEAGDNGWYVSGVTVRVLATDTVSGEVKTWWRLDDGPPRRLTGDIVYDQEGVHTLRVWATDAAGNRTEEWVKEIKVDLAPPNAWVLPKPVYLTDVTPFPGGLVSFEVQWKGVDTRNGSGIATYDVQYREGTSGLWVLWLRRVTQTSATFYGQEGHTYAFRVRARDNAGHQQPYTTRPRGDMYTHIQVVDNGDFRTGNFQEWETASVGEPGLMLNVKPAEHYTGRSSPAAWLGDPSYGGAENPGLVPIGGAVISQTVTVPTLDQMPYPTLEFWYHMVTWDVKYAYSHNRWQDTFEFRILALDGTELDKPLRDGYDGNNPPVKGIDYAVKHDLGWRRLDYDLRPYAGETVIIEFSNWNRWDNLYNTYTIVDDVAIVDPTLTRRQFFPAVPIPRTGNQRPPVSVPARKGSITDER